MPGPLLPLSFALVFSLECSFPASLNGWLPPLFQVSSHMNLYQWALLWPLLLKIATTYCPPWALLPLCALFFITALLTNRCVFIILFIDYVSSVGQELQGFLLDLSPASRIAFKYLLHTWRSHPSVPRFSLRHWVAVQNLLDPKEGSSLSSHLLSIDSFSLALNMVDNPLTAKHSVPALTELSPECWRLVCNAHLDV